MSLPSFNYIIRNTFSRTLWLSGPLRNCKVRGIPDCRGISSFKSLLRNSVLVALLMSDVVRLPFPSFLRPWYTPAVSSTCKSVEVSCRTHWFTNSSLPGISFVIVVRILPGVECGITVLSNTWPGYDEVMFILIDIWYSCHEENYHANRLLTLQTEHRS